MNILFLTQAAVRKKQIDKLTYLNSMYRYLVRLDELGQKIIIKPHPRELTDYDKISQKLNNVVVAKGDLSEFIETADIVISFRSSAILKAMISKKPVIVIDLLDEVVGQRYDLSRENRVLKICTASDDLLQVVQEVIDDKEAIIKKQNKYLKSFFYKTDGKANDRIAQYIFDTIAIPK